MKKTAEVGHPIHDLLAERWSPRAFEDRAVEPGKLGSLLEAARWAPNHRFTEPWHFYRLGPETADQVVALNTQLVAAKKGADAAEAKRQKWESVPTWLLVTCDRNEDALVAKEDYAATCCAIQNIQLSLWDNGVGCKWTTGDVTRDPALADLCWFNPASEEVVGLLMIGFAAEVPPPVRNKALPQICVDLP